ncbi:PspA/IM30 family protein [Paenibacillus sp. GSMTC-2017]|uniref:PspA/IM30 family protein n=1 Tax=Paenibacillus sp. GSMTC-2017 TaxID=2794350 RepID=UPI0018D7E60E|nr:PspA/IM30 family protein [Paenibacillus sp. GSMTC-2017]MBH5320129.1 PspA/IM30 family protein [Paenibacillus sp. GSMTC-2017]
MGILHRVFSMTKAAANEVLDKIENPVMMLNHYLRDLDEEIAKVERSIAQQHAQTRFLQTKLGELHGQASYYDQKAEQAATAGREAETRTALEAKLLYLEQAEETARLHHIAEQAAIELTGRLESLKEEKVRLQGKRNELITRVRQAEGTSSSSQTNSPYGGSTAAQGFDRIEQKVMEWEAGRELAKGSYSVYSSGNGYEQQQEQRNARVDEELNRLLQKNSSN